MRLQTHSCLLICLHLCTHAVRFKICSSGSEFHLEPWNCVLPPPTPVKYCSPFLPECRPQGSRPRLDPPASFLKSLHSTPLHPKSNPTAPIHRCSIAAQDPFYPAARDRELCDERAAFQLRLLPGGLQRGWVCRYPALHSKFKLWARSSQHSTPTVALLSLPEASSQ